MTPPSPSSHAFRATAAGLLLLAAGCATVPVPMDAGEAACAAMLAAMDQRIDAAGARDAEHHRLAGLPHLRSNRLVASFAGELDTVPRRDAFLARLRALDAEAREVEFRNLGATAAEGAAASRCADRLATSDAVRLEAIRARVAVPDAYRTPLRVLGLYALTSRPFMSGVERWQASAAGAFGPRGEVAVRRYVPPPAPAAAMPTRRDALGIPVLSSDEAAALLAHHAPVIDIEVGSDDDLPGRLGWRDGRPAVDAATPTLYTRLSHTRFEGEVHLQLVYTAWFPRRAARRALDLLAGELDGVTLRLTLDRDGSVLAADSIHPCGCYHMFFPGAALVPRAPPAARMEWAFAPAALPAGAGRLAVRLAAGVHHIVGLARDAGGDGTPYALRDDRELSLLPDGNRTRSLYGPDGLVAGSERGERFLFWPMGIVSAGTMRQWGHHATAFVGRRHFDDADLIGARFARRRSD